MNKLSEQAYRVLAGDDWPSYSDYINDKIDNRLIRLELKQLEKQSAKINSGYDYNSLLPLHIKFEELTNDQKYKLIESKVFGLQIIHKFFNIQFSSGTQNSNINYPSSRVPLKLI